jgi:hypothetical protein
MTFLVLTIGVLVFPSHALQPEDQPPTKVDDAIWYNDRLFDTMLLGDIKKPNQKSLDALYNFGSSGLIGQRSISEAGPGNPEYNGGRWKVIPVTFTPLGISIHDPDNDGTVNFELTSVEQLMHHAGLGHLTFGEPVRYFICPLIPHGSI